MILKQYQLSGAESVASIVAQQTRREKYSNMLTGTCTSTIVYYCSMYMYNMMKTDMWPVTVW